MDMPAKDIPKDYIIERLDAILKIFAKMDGELDGKEGRVVEIYGS